MTDTVPSLAQVRASIHIHDVDTVTEWFRVFNEGVKRARDAEPFPLILAQREKDNERNKRRRAKKGEGA